LGSRDGSRAGPLREGWPLKRQQGPTQKGGGRAPAREDASRAALPGPPAPASPPAPAPEVRSVPSEEPVTLARLRLYRKLTRAVAEHLRGELAGILETLTPLFHAETILGDYVQKSMISPKAEAEESVRAQLGPDRWGRGSELAVKREAAQPLSARELEERRAAAKGSVPLKEAIKGADAAFRDLERLYESIAKKRPFDLGLPLKPPLPINTSALEIFPVDYPHMAKSSRESKRVMVTAPLNWIVVYAGFSPKRLRAILADQNRSRDELQRVLIHYLLLHIVLDRKPGLRALLDSLHFPVRTDSPAEFGELPVTVIASAVKTERPADDVILESTDLSGVSVFEEVVRVTNVAAMADPRKERLLEVVKRETEEEDVGSG